MASTWKFKEIHAGSLKEFLEKLTKEHNDGWRMFEFLGWLSYSEIWGAYDHDGRYLAAILTYGAPVGS